ncbi:Zn-ribbon domain-containing OB-fold protein [Nocardia bovistercoris]|uniref:OB-fold domain-containing protein n=1 Tax=Nocardia bovistercoris TaxID=2785916 RepID=A0A931N763_9NOCA|nr:OB-fold domain-containing protein [Nocardia bovistercoris]
MTARPLPVPDELSAPYWAAARRHVLALARCGHCAMFTVAPGPICPHCRCSTPEFVFEPVSGRGTVRSWTVIRRATLLGFGEDVPYSLVDVELDEQTELRVIGRLLDGPTTPMRHGLRVRVAFEDVTEEFSIPAFTRAAPW